MRAPTIPSAARRTVPTKRRAVKKGEPAWEIATLFPPQGEWTEEDYLDLDAKTKQLIELVNGCLEVLPMPTTYHQRIVLFLFRLFDAFVMAHSLGEILLAPMPIRLRAKNLREPDLMFMKAGRIKNPFKPPQGADLALEVVSEGEENRERDLVEKREEYAKAKIAEYWIVDPAEKRITVLTLRRGTYKEHGIFGPGQKATSLLLPGFEVDVDAVFAAGQG